MGVPAMVGAAAGAALNRKNPLQGAMLGGFVGGAGGALFPNALSSIAPAAETGILPSALSGSTTTAANQALVSGSLPSSAAGVGFQTAAPSTVPTSIFGGGLPVTNAAMQGQTLAQTAAMQRPLSLGMPGVEASSLYEPTFMDKVGQLGQYAQQNPTLTAMAAQAGQGLLQQPERQLQSPGLMRGSPSQVAAPQYQVGIPKVSLI